MNYFVILFEFSDGSLGCNSILAKNKEHAIEFFQEYNGRKIVKIDEIVNNE